MLVSIPTDIWATSPADVGRCALAAPISFDVKPTSTIYQYQYKHKPQAKAGLPDAIQSLLEAGVLPPTQSPCNNPVLPLPKPGMDKYRMAHNLRLINNIVITPCLPVPNPHAELSHN